MGAGRYFKIPPGPELGRGDPPRPPPLVFESCRPLKLDDRVLPRNGHSIPGSRPSFPFKCQMGPKTPPGGAAAANFSVFSTRKRDAIFEKTAFLEHQETTALATPPGPHLIHLQIPTWRRCCLSSLVRVAVFPFFLFPSLLLSPALIGCVTSRSSLCCHCIALHADDEPPPPTHPPPCVAFTCSFLSRRPYQATLDHRDEIGDGGFFSGEGR